MDRPIAERVVHGLGLLVVLAALVAVPAASARAAGEVDSALLQQSSSDRPIQEQLASIVAAIPAISADAKARRDLAQATFCLSQSVLGVLLYGILRVTGNVVCTQEMNEVTIVVTGSRSRWGASLGRYLFVPAPFLTEAAVRHEYGHTMQGYRHGPFYLLLEGTASFVQAAVSIVSPSFAADYLNRWPENEANELGGVTE